MHLAERNEGEFRVYAAAIEAEGGVGFYAGVVVKPWGSRSLCGRGEVFRDERLEDGMTWESAEEALEFALRVGAAAVRAQRAFAAHVA
ncbi:MAG: hypothetical protein IH627_10745 [Rubrivivax sp.]|nr:hypothetical protein [Rubrivivax sp.]